MTPAPHPSLMTSDDTLASDALRWHGTGLFGRLRRRVLATIAAGTAWLSLVLVFLAFWATGFSLLQDIVVVVVSLLVLTAVVLGLWISFGLRFLDRW